MCLNAPCLFFLRSSKLSFALLKKKKCSVSFDKQNNTPATTPATVARTQTAETGQLWDFTEPVLSDHYLAKNGASAKLLHAAAKVSEMSPPGAAKIRK